ncbi:hypothetical protein Glove_692g52 [Diversispora epigaea]|uniref:Uncharacterized protein n=1 Tax=Diversispora epigaea TaxID=1348612 RepID=A0A397G5F0_9GLOM|nr:hypothetical protein Glove_692g52 [Diversispora epigaea]
MNKEECFSQEGISSVTVVSVSPQYTAIGIFLLKRIPFFADHEFRYNKEKCWVRIPFHRLYKSKSSRSRSYERRFSQQSSQSSTSSIARRMSNQLQVNSLAIQENDEMEYAEEIPAIENSPNLNSKKHTSEPSKKPSIKKVKILVKKEESPILKKLIEELTSTVSEKSEKVTEVDENNTNFLPEAATSWLFHYNKITHAESKSEIANREVIECYFNFGEAMRKRFEHYRNLNHGERACLALVNENNYLTILPMMQERYTIYLTVSVK